MVVAEDPLQHELWVLRVHMRALVNMQGRGWFVFLQEILVSFHKKWQFVPYLLFNWNKLVTLYTVGLICQWDEEKQHNKNWFQNFLCLTDSSQCQESITEAEDIKPNSVHMALQVPQYFFITAGEVMFSVTGLEFSYSQVRFTKNISSYYISKAIKELQDFKIQL